MRSRSRPSQTAIRLALGLCQGCNVSRIRAFVEGLGSRRVAGSEPVRPAAPRMKDTEDLDNTIAHPIRNQVRSSWNDQLSGAWDSARTTDRWMLCESVRGVKDAGGDSTSRFRIVARDVRPRFFEIVDGAAKPDDPQRGGSPSSSLPQDSSHAVTWLCSTNSEAGARSAASRVFRISSTCHS